VDIFPISFSHNVVCSLTVSSVVRYRLASGAEFVSKYWQVLVKYYDTASCSVKWCFRLWCYISASHGILYGFRTDVALKQKIQRETVCETVHNFLQFVYLLLLFIHSLQLNSHVGRW